MRKYITNRQYPVNAQPVPKDVATRYIEEYKTQSSNVANPKDEAKNGNICSGQKRNIETFNNTISQGIPGQVVEIHGHRQTGTVMAKFENADGSLAEEVVTSADTPGGVDREEYYYEFEHVFGERNESFGKGTTRTTGNQVDQEEDIPSNPSVTEEDNTVSNPAPLVTVSNEEQNNNPKTDGLSNDLILASSSSVLGKRSLDDSEEQPKKRPKNNEDDDNGGSGPTTSG